MKVFVAGATGAIGRRLVPLLVESGFEVVAITRSPDKQDALRALGAEPVVADALDRAAVMTPELARALGAKPPRRVPVWLGRLAAGEVGVSMMTRIHGASNAKAKSTLSWSPHYPSYREGFRDGLRHHHARPRRAGATKARASAQKSSRMTRRRTVGRLTSTRPASAKTLGVPTCSSSAITFFGMIG